jgi:hypothetical protein
MKEFRKINEAEVNTEDTKKLKDILSGGYESFVSKLKKNAKDPKVLAILNLGKDDGMPTDEEIQVQDNVSYSCDTLNWNIGDNKFRMKFTIPVKGRKKWWEFWKKSESKQRLKDLVSKLKEPVDFDREYFLPD